MKLGFSITEEDAVASGACVSRVREVLARGPLEFPIWDGELFFLLRAISFSAFRAGYKNLSGANLTRADLTRANLTGANLSGANLDGADLDGANLDE